MNQNPYAAPAQAYAPPPPPPPTQGQPGMLDATATFSTAWAVFKEQWGPLVGGWFLTFIVTTVPGQATNGVQMATRGSASAPNPLTLGVVGAITAIVLIGLSTFLQVGLLRMSLQAARGEKVNFSLLFSGADRFWASLGLMVLQTMLVVVGCAALLVPGLFVYLALSFGNFFVVDARMGPVDAMKASLEIVKTQWGQVFLFWLLTGLLGMGGLLLCCVGYFAAVPLAQLAAAVAFIQMSGRGVVPSAQPPGAWPAQPA